MACLIIFGGSGDLAKRKLIPALSNLMIPGCKVVAYGRSPLEGTYHKILTETSSCSAEFLKTVEYVTGEYSDISPLSSYFTEDTVCYFSLPPHVYPEILSQLVHAKLKAVGIEKPFGSSLESFLEISEHCNESTHFIDHYLFKPMMMLLPILYRNNTDLPAFLCKENICYVEASFCESIGAEGRPYYDEVGCVKDVIQNHLSVCLAALLVPKHTAAQDAQSSNRADIIKDMKIDVSRCIYGQYKGYAEEMGGSSATETFACLPLTVDSPAWAGVPFLLLGGKSLRTKRTGISFMIRKAAYRQALGLLSSDTDHPDICDIMEMEIRFEIAPQSEVYILIVANGKEKQYSVYAPKMLEKLLHEQTHGRRDYEVVFNGLMVENSIAHCKEREVELLWRLFDPSLSLKAVQFHYEQGISMPEPAKCLIQMIKPKE